MPAHKAPILEKPCKGCGMPIAGRPCDLRKRSYCSNRCQQLGTRNSFYRHGLSYTKEYNNERLRDYIREHPERHRARQAVTNAIRDGRLVRQPCRICGTKAQGHHTDYARPLDVIWLCPRHHRELHLHESQTETV